MLRTVDGANVRCDVAAPVAAFSCCIDARLIRKLVFGNAAIFEMPTFDVRRSDAKILCCAIVKVSTSKKDKVIFGVCMIFIALTRG